MALQFKEVRTCPEHGFALDEAGACLRCLREARLASRARRATRELIAGAILFPLLGLGAAWARARTAPPDAPPVDARPGDVAPREPRPSPSASAGSHAVLAAWQQELARVEAKRARELAHEAELQAAAEKQREVDALKLPDPPPAAPSAPPALVAFTHPWSDAWAYLPYTAFLADDPDVEQRNRIWPLFHRAEGHARAFATTPSRWPYLRQVHLGGTGHAGGIWASSGVIALRTDRDPRVLFHEVFHPAFFASELNPAPSSATRDRDSAWNEAFCDAFAYYAAREILPEPEAHRVTGLDRLMAKSDADALIEGGVGRRKYGYPASLIVKQAGGANGSLRSFHALWLQLIALRRERGEAVLDDFFRFSPPIEGVEF